MKKTIDLTLTPREIAEAFADMNDEDQAQFFIEVGAIFESWGVAERNMQASKIGGHLRTCACSTWEAREVVRTIAAEIDQTNG